MPECESTPIGGHAIWQPAWLANAIPHKDGDMEKCRRYTSRAEPLMLDNSRRDECPIEMFMRNQTNSCDEFVFKGDEIGLSNEVSWS